MKLLRLTLLEVIIWLAIVAIISALVTPAFARVPNAPKPLFEVITLTITAVAGRLAVIGLVLLILFHTVKWLMVRLFKTNPSNNAT